MGRGGSQTRALNEARELLFGPRRARPLPVEIKKERRREERRQAREEKQMAYYENIIASGQALREGSGSELAELLESEAGHGFKAVEKEGLRDLIEQIHDFSTAAGSPDDNDAQMIANRQDLIGLVRLCDRASELSQQRHGMACEALLTYSQALANQELIDQLDKDAIGPLPAAMLGRDFCDHLVKDDKPLCGGDPYYNAISQKTSSSMVVLEKVVDCEQCMQLFQEDRDCCDYLDNWPEEMAERSLNEWGWRHFNIIRKASGDDQARVDYIVDEHKKLSQEEFNRGIEPFSDYRFS